MGLIIGLLIVGIVCYLVFWIAGMFAAQLPQPARVAIMLLVGLLLLYWIFGGHSPFYARATPLWRLPS